MQNLNDLTRERELRPLRREVQNPMHATDRRGVVEASLKIAATARGMSSLDLFHEGFALHMMGKREAAKGVLMSGLYAATREQPEIVSNSALRCRMALLRCDVPLDETDRTIERIRHLVLDLRQPGKIGKES